MLHDFIEQSHITFLLSLRIFRVELSLIRVHPSLEFSRIQTLALDYEADMPIENRNQRIHQIISLCLTIFTFAFSLLASLVSIAVIISMICHCFRNTKSLHEKTALMLSFHIYLLIGVLMMNVTSTNIQTILGDLFGIRFHSQWCLFQGYLLSVGVCALYNTFVLQVCIISIIFCFETCVKV